MISSIDVVFFYSKFLPLNFDSHALTRHCQKVERAQSDSLTNSSNFYNFFYFGSDFL